MTGAPYLPGFGRCGIPRLSTAHSLLATGLHVHGHLHPVHSGAEVCGIPHLPKPGRYGAPVIRYGPGREKLRLAASHSVVQIKNVKLDLIVDSILGSAGHLQHAEDCARIPAA